MRRTKGKKGTGEDKFLRKATAWSKKKRLQFALLSQLSKVFSTFFRTKQNVHSLDESITHSEINKLVKFLFRTERARTSCPPSKPWQTMANHSFRKSNKRTVEIKTW